MPTGHLFRRSWLQVRCAFHWACHNWPEYVHSDLCSAAPQPGSTTGLMVSTCSAAPALALLYAGCSASTLVSVKRCSVALVAGTDGCSEALLAGHDRCSEALLAGHDCGARPRRRRSYGSAGGEGPLARPRRRPRARSCTGRWPRPAATYGPRQTRVTLPPPRPTQPLTAAFRA